MKGFRKAAAWLLVLMMLVVMVGCKDQTPEVPTTEPETTIDTRQDDLTAKYLTAVDMLPKDAIGMEITGSRSVTVGGQTYSESNKISMSLWNMDAEELLAKVKETVTFGNDSYTVQLEEIYADGKVYQSYEDSDFYAEISAAEFMDRYVPVQLLDPAKYTLDANADESVITFEAASAAEEWAVPQEAELIAASGSATVDQTGKLEKTDYTVEYQYGPAQIKLTYQITFEAAGRQPTVPETTDGYVLLQDISAAYALEHAYGYLNQTRHVSSDIRSLLVSAAGGIMVIDNRGIDAYAVGNTYAARCETHVGYTNYATKQEEEQDLDEKFINGKYTMSQNGGREESVSTVNQAAFEGYISGMLAQQIAPGSWIAEVEVTDLGSLILFEYVGNEEMAQYYCSDICATYFGGADVLNDLASSYTTDTMNYYLALDKYTLLPTAVGLKYEGTHTIQKQKYPLNLQVDQSFDLASMDAYDAVFEKSIEEEAPENPATPLFYHVTGDNGQEMWLLGTIHVGDNRTAFLPQEIYDAFYASDALAIECDTEAFSDQAEEDKELQEQISACYAYSDGTGPKDHIVTEDLYDTAVQLLKATGSYNFNSEYEKVCWWSSYIDNYFMKQGYVLSSEKGVEKRLLALAEEDDMAVREVESSLFQLQMMSNFSEHLQEVRLFSTMAADARENWEGSQELYELWCAGDEAALTEKIVSDSTWELKEDDFDLDELEGEELERAQAVLADLENINAQLVALQQEYDKAMSVDRNDGMLKVAQEYLESGDVVFYAVGLAHLLAENGLVNALRDAGYTVELVTYQ